MTTTEKLVASLEGSQQLLKKIAKLNASILKIEELTPDDHLSAFSLKEFRYRLTKNLIEMLEEVKNESKREVDKIDKALRMEASMA